MAFPKGNQLWRARTTVGRPRLFDSSESLWLACCEYFQWVEDNPLYEERLVSYKGESFREPVAKKRVMTIEGLCIFLGIVRQSWKNMKSYGQDFLVVIEYVENIIYQQKVEGAAAELFNANIISRELGLRDSQSIDHQSGDGSMSPGQQSVDDMTEDELKAELRRRGLPEDIYDRE